MHVAVNLITIQYNMNRIKNFKAYFKAHFKATYPLGKRGRNYIMII